ncbi:MAG: MATE family efflux transporter [Eubacteriales bacterium]
MNIKSAVEHLYAPEYLLGKQKWAGDKYSAKEVYKTLSNVAWPAAAEAVLIGMMSFVDTIMVSSVGSFAIAATGLSNQPRMLFFAVFFALNAGVTAIVSRRRGENNKEGANKCLAQALMLCVLLSVALCGFAVAIARPLLIFTGALPDTIEPAVVYFRITIIGMAFVSLGMVINAAQRGIGNTKISMRTNLTANAVNVVFNFLLINGIWFFPRLEVKGAAIATLMGNVVSFLMSVYSISKPYGFLHVKVKDCLRFDGEYLRLLIKISSSAAVEQVFVRAGFFAYTKIVAVLGTTAFATHQICMSIINISFCVGDGLGIAASSLVGQNLGRRRPDMSVIYGRAAQRVALLVSTVLIVLFSAGGKILMDMFTDETEIINLGAKLLFVMAFTSPAQISQLVFSGSLRGAGDTKYVAYTSLISIGLVRPIITYILCFPLGLGLIGAWISLLVDQYMRMGFAAFRFSRGKWLKIKV